VADEIFSTGNYSKVVPVTRIDNRPLPSFYTKAENCIGNSRIHERRTPEAIVESVPEERGTAPRPLSGRVRPGEMRDMNRA